MLLIVSGTLGPVLIGEISSELPAIAGADPVSQRRARGGDAPTYGTIGPAIVAAFSV